MTGHTDSLVFSISAGSHIQSRGERVTGEDQYAPGWILAENIADALDPRRHNIDRFLAGIRQRVEDADLDFRSEANDLGWKLSAKTHDNKWVIDFWVSGIMVTEAYEVLGLIDYVADKMIKPFKGLV
jgi:hypothetical protein